MAAVIDADLRRQANLRSLQRIDPKIIDLGTTVSHVVLYEFISSKKSWEKSNIDGSLFVAKRSDWPMFKLILLNRSSNENLEVAITGSFQMHVSTDYLIFRDSAFNSDEVRGLWFHDREERDNFVRYVENVVKAMGQMEKREKQKSEPAVKGSNDAGAALLATLNLGSKTEAQQVETGQDEQKQSTSAAAAAGLNTTGSSNIILDKKNLQLALLSLIQDERFLDLIHAQYIKVANARNARGQQTRRDSDK